MTWELGGGLGHTTLLAPIAKRLVQRGYRVLAALKDLSRADAVMASVGVELLQAPTKTRRMVDAVRLPHTFAHILHNVGFADSRELSGMVQAWGNLYRLVQPNRAGRRARFCGAAGRRRHRLYLSARRLPPAQPALLASPYSAGR